MTSDASVASTSFMFMFDDVPEPVWNTSTGKWSSQPPEATSAEAAWTATPTSFGITFSRALTTAATLDRCQGADQRPLDRHAADREVLDGALRLGLPLGMG